MRVLILGIGDSVATFVLNRLVYLNKNGVSLVVETSSKNTSVLKSSLRDVEFVEKMNFRRTNFLKLCMRLFHMISNFNLVLRLYRHAPAEKIFSKLNWVFESFHLVGIKDIDLVHFQWVSMGSTHFWMKEFYNVPSIGSARGSQVTIYPFTDLNYLETIKVAFEKLDYIHCVSDSIKQSCIGLGALSEKVFVNYNGIDIERFHAKSACQSNGGVFEMVSIGLLIWRKSFVFQLLLVRKLLDRGNNVKLTIIGKGTDLGQLNYYISKMNLTNSIVMLESIEHSELPVFFTRFHAYISTSIAEGLANSVMEAMACSLIPIVFDCEGMNEVIENNVTGIVVPWGDVDQMTSRVESLIENTDLRCRMALAGSDFIRENFNSENHVRDIMRIYKSIIGEIQE